MFKELTLKDAEKALTDEINRLVDTIPPNDSEEKSKFRTQMDGFQQLFERYLHSTSETFDWKSMEPIPTECVSFLYLSCCHAFK